MYSVVTIIYGKCARDLSCDLKNLNENVYLHVCQSYILATLLMVPESTNASELEKKSFCKWSFEPDRALEN